MNNPSRPMPHDPTVGRSPAHDDQVGVVGLGYLGRGIVACLLGHGMRVMGYDTRSDAHQQTREAVRESLGELVRHASFDPALLNEWPGRYTAARSIDELAGCDFIIESVFEDLEVKQAVFDQLETTISATTPVATNTSALPISQLQQRRKHPQRLLGMHFAQPVYANRFLEIIPGDRTSPDIMAAAEQLGRRIGKDPCLLQKDVPGFIVNRMAYAVYREAAHLLETGVADAETIDRAFCQAAGIWATLCGPFRWIDISGGPGLYAKVMEDLLPTLSNCTTVPEPFRRLADADAHGTANGRGFYQYSGDDARRWEELLHRHVWNMYRSTESGQTPAIRTIEDKDDKSAGGGE